MKRARRSELATPASSEKMMAKAAASTADLVFLDLEDAVAENQKVEARGKAVEALRSLEWRPGTKALRINALDTHYAYEDIIEVVSGAREALDVIIVPKVKAARDVWWVAVLLDQLEARHGITKKIGIEVLIEEVEALIHVDEIAFASDRLEALIFGAGDFAASQGVRIEDIGAKSNYPGDIWQYARNRVVVAARAAKIDAIDAPFGAIDDPAGYREQATMASTLGFVGKWAIHPSQIDIANDVYSPGADEVARARAIAKAYYDGAEQGLGAVIHEGKMIDAASVRIAQNVIDVADLIGM